MPPGSVGLAEAYLSEQFYLDTCRYLPKHDDSKIPNQFADTRTKKERQNVHVLPLKMAWFPMNVFISSNVNFLSTGGAHHFAKNAELPIWTHFFSPGFFSTPRQAFKVFIRQHA